MASYKPYNVRGRGLCIILANFVGKRPKTSHLKGYIHDVKALKDFFQKIYFTVTTKVGNLPLQNLSRQEFEDRMLELQSFLKEEWKAKGYDRLFVFILSHGGQQGLNMCKSGTRGTKKEKDSDGNLVYMPVDTIISYFTHKTVPNLEGVPKCFFIQACRGNSYAQVAVDTPGTPGVEVERDQNPDELEYDTTSSCLTITGSDIFVAYSTHEYTRCFVDDKKGSAFISTTVKVMNQSYKTKDIFEIMTDVIHEISEQEHPRFFPCNSSVYDIKLKHNDTYCSFKVCGNVGGDAGGDTDLPMAVQNSSYYGFISHNRLTLDLKNNHYLSGWVYFKKNKQKCCTLESLSSEQVEAFCNTKHFLMRGEVRSKESSELLAKGTVIIENGELYLEGDIIRLGADERKHLNLSVIIDKHPEKYYVSDIKGRPAKLYIDGQLYGCGQIDAEDEDSDEQVYGIHTDVYQLPLITSTLRKRLFVVEPEKTAVDRQNMDAIMQLTKQFEENLSQLMMARTSQVDVKSISGPSSKSLDVAVEKPVL